LNPLVAPIVVPVYHCVPRRAVIGVPGQLSAAVACSRWQLASQPSPVVELPSSHVSPGSSARFGHVGPGIVHTPPWSKKPVLQRTPHVPAVHVATPFAVVVHAFVQEPHALGESSRCSQPSA
jgi:hypothetical protein